MYRVWSSDFHVGPISDLKEVWRDVRVHGRCIEVIDKRNASRGFVLQKIAQMDHDRRAPKSTTVLCIVVFVNIMSLRSAKHTSEVQHVVYARGYHTDLFNYKHHATAPLVNQGMLIIAGSHARVF